MLEETARLLNEDIRASIREFESAVQKVETRAGKVIAERVKEATSAIALRESQRNGRSSQLLWIVIGFLTSLGFLAVGVWIGAHYIR